MAISRIGAASTEATTITIPTGHNPGDFLIIFAFRDGSVTNPTIPAGWTSITNTTDGTLCSVSAAWKRASTTAETSGTWTNATGLICHVYRGQLSAGTPIGTFSPAAGTTNTITYAAAANANPIGSSWYLAFAAHRSIDTTIQSPPTNMSLTTNTVGAAAEYAGFDTNGLATVSWPSTDVAISGTASGWQTMVIEIKAQGNTINNFAFASSINALSSNPGIISVTEKIK